MSELCRILDIDRGCTPSPALPGVAGADGLGGGGWPRVMSMKAITYEAEV